MLVKEAIRRSGHSRNRTQAPTACLQISAKLKTGKQETTLMLQVKFVHLKSLYCTVRYTILQPLENPGSYSSISILNMKERLSCSFPMCSYNLVIFIKQPDTLKYKHLSRRVSPEMTHYSTCSAYNFVMLFFVIVAVIYIFICSRHNLM